ncbi:NADH-quinone oxidoreductase subunit I [uncultured Campylobacter sp.]|uniref:NADH-quinone oxidoreductase subunit I n=1 Tax=uncultured Campylobacter sp. TaxID=218934 RepID=UPI002612D1AF|nr:4Fe-4S binding protein [uncultured Campylobacter sp.]
MAVKILDICISCGSCIDECPVEAIVDESDNPNGDDFYYVYADKCVECVGYNDEPACADACPTDGCIVWSDVVGSQPSRENITKEQRANQEPVNN